MFDAQFQENTKQLGEIEEKSPDTVGAFKEVEGMEIGRQLGRQLENSDFWDAFQDKGNRSEYSYAFTRWSHEEINPKYPIYAPALYQTFYACKMRRLPKEIYPVGSSFDNSYCAFGLCSELEEISFDLPFVTNGSNLNSMNGIFQQCGKLETIKYISFDSHRYNFTNTFVGCKALKNVTVGGVIASTIIFKDCPLTVESAKSIILALKDYRDTEYDGAFTCYFSSATWALLDAEGTAYEGFTWREYLNAITWNY